jgi:flagellar protein FlgJ
MLDQQLSQNLSGRGLGLADAMLCAAEPHAGGTLRREGAGGSKPMLPMLPGEAGAVAPKSRGHAQAYAPAAVPPT